MQAAPPAPPKSRPTDEDGGFDRLLELTRRQFASLAGAWWWWATMVYAASAVIEGAEEASACGIGLSAEAPWNLTLRVSTARSVATYLIDRWD